MPSMQSEFEETLTTTRLPVKSPTTIESQVPPKKPFRKAPWIVGGLAVYSFTAYGVYLYQSYQAAILHSKDLSVPLDVADRYDSTAEHYDSDLDNMELFMGLGWLRSVLVSQAKGDVLEVSVGTGRNSKYYDTDQVDSIVCVDSSAAMLDMARSKFKGLLSTTPHRFH
jgi:methyltransferase OMS1